MDFKEGDIIKLPEKREVLFEKWNEESSKQIEMENFFYEKLNGCQIRFLKDYPNYTFFIKNDKCLFEIYKFNEKTQKSKNRNFNVRYDEIWSVFENRFALDYQQIQVFIEHEVEKLLKLNGFTPFGAHLLNLGVVEKLLKLNGFTPVEVGFTPAVGWKSS